MPSHNEKAIARVVARLNEGRTLKAYNALDHEDTTIGPYTEAVNRGFHFAVIGWKTGRTSLFKTAEDAAYLFVVTKVGSTRAREASLK